MSEWTHRIYILILLGIGFLTFVVLAYWGMSYYTTSLEERPFLAEHSLLKPSGPVGHGLGILGTLLILVGVFGYIGRKKKKFLPRTGALKYWLEFHIFLCSVGPILILFHTAFKFGGIVSISFWSMVAVVLSGIIGRFIYIQIPRTIQGQELSLVEIKEMKEMMGEKLRSKYKLSDSSYNQLVEATGSRKEITGKGFLGGAIIRHRENRRLNRRVKSIIRQTNLTGKDARGVWGLIRNEMALQNKIDRLNTMQKLFKYWHVAHLPFALIMLVIMVVHVAITIVFGYKWIF